jgi:hypothetical protein
MLGKTMRSEGGLKKDKEGREMEMERERKRHKKDKRHTNVIKSNRSAAVNDLIHDNLLHLWVNSFEGR